MKKLLFILIVATQSVFGQDIHFSQYDYMPLTFNPGLTGSGPGTHRIGASYREQNTFFTNGYVTMGAYYDGKYMVQKKGRVSFLGLGAIFLSDHAGDSRMGISQFGLSAAYLWNYWRITFFQ